MTPPPPTPAIRTDAQPRLGVALSGGTARTVAHVGVLKAFEAAGLRIDCLAGTSGGALMACMYAAGVPVKEMERLALKARWKDIAAVTIPRLGFLSSHRIQEFVEQTIGKVDLQRSEAAAGGRRHQLGNGHKRVFTTGQVSHAVRASCSIPRSSAPAKSTAISTSTAESSSTCRCWPSTLRRRKLVIAVNLGRTGKRFAGRGTCCSS